MKRFDARTQQWLAWSLLVLVILVYAVEMSHQALLRYDTFKATAFDLGNMDQVLWNTLHGRLFEFTNQAVDWFGPPTRLAIHFEPIILPLSLLYAFHGDPRILLVFQTLVLVSGALPVFLVTRKYLPQWPVLAALMAAAYLLSPGLLGLNIFDFHPVSLATSLLLYAILALEYKRYVWFVIACILAGACKEDIPLALAMLGILLIWKYKLRGLGIALFFGGLLWSVLAFAIIIPHFYPGAQSNNFWYRYEALGSSPGAAIGNLILHPWLLFTTFITIDRFYYLVGLVRSTGFLALLAPEWLLPALPSLAVNLLSTDPLLYSGVYQYNAAIIPFVMIAAIHGVKRLTLIWYGWRGENHEEAWNKRGTLASRISRLTFLTWCNAQWQRFSERMIPLAKKVSVARLQWVMFGWITIMVGLNFFVAAPQLNIFWADHQPGSREQHIQQLLNMIPPEASVSAGESLNPHLSDRQLLAVFPSVCLDSHCNQTVQYVVVDLNSVFPEDRAQITSKLNQLVTSGQFRVLARAEGVVLLVSSGTG